MNLRLQTRTLRVPAEADASHVRAVWEPLFRSDSALGPYVSPSWIDAWVRTYATRLRPRLAEFVNDTGVHAACLLVRRIRLAALLPHVRLHLNTDGEDEGEEVVIQHNALVAERPFADAAATALAEWVNRQHIDEVQASGFDEPGVERLQRAFDGWTSMIEWRDAHYVDLDQLRSEGGDHLAALSRNTREQIRRSIGLYKARGEITVESARNEQQADTFFEEMVSLHTARWEAEGEVGSFASPRRLQFHRAVIRRGVLTGAAQLLRVSAGGQVIGLVYNIIANGKVNFYQSGLKYEDNKHLKPGLVTHHFAILHCLEHGFSEYDFLVSGPGEGRYKASLSTAHRRLGWLTLFRPGWRQAYFSLVRAVRRHLRPVSPAPARAGSTTSGEHSAAGAHA